MIGLAVAIILFEGGMTLRFKDSRRRFTCRNKNGYSCRADRLAFRNFCSTLYSGLTMGYIRNGRGVIRSNRPNCDNAAFKAGSL